MGSFLNNPNFYPFGQQYFPLKNNSKLSPQIFWYIQRDRQDFAHILPTFPSRLKFQIPFQGDLWQNIQYDKFSRIFSTPLWEGDLHKTWYGFYQYPKLIPYQGDFTKHFQFPQLFQTSNPPHCLNYGSKGIWAFSRQHHWCPEILPDLGLKS